MSKLSNKNKALMLRIYEEMWNGRNPTTVAARLFSTPEGVERFVSQFLSSFPDLKHTVEEIVSEEDIVVVRFSAHRTHTGAWLGFEATDKPTCWDKASLIEQIEGARI